eukprot:Nitzschia sp. Nitz4//scaffold3_size479765//262608//262931//NITZ4_000109-RA/size479765-processed-gene-1.234-mRNA-1//1//CDS//3329550785//3440//frame0
MATRKDLLSLYRQLLRSCETYPSKNRGKIYAAIQEDFKENRLLDPSSTKAQNQVQVAYKGLQQLHQFDRRCNVNFTVDLEQNPFPKPEGYQDKRTERAEQILQEDRK